MPERVKSGAMVATRLLISSSLPVSRASTSPWVPSLLRRVVGAPGLQVETTLATPGRAASSRVTAEPALAAAGVSTVPVWTVTSRMRLGSPVRKSASSCCAAQLELRAGVVEPPGGEVALDRPADQAGDREEEQRDEEDKATAPGHQPAEPSHPRPPSAPGAGIRGERPAAPPPRILGDV